MEHMTCGSSPALCLALLSHWIPEDMYEMVVVRGERSADLLMEHEAFEEVVQGRTSIEEDSSMLFRLYDLLMLPSTPDSLVVLCNRCKHLCLDCLRDD